MEEEPKREVTPESEACPKSPKPKKETPTRPLLSYFPKWNRTQIIAITLTTISLASIFSVGRWHLLMLPLQEDNVIWSNTCGGLGHESVDSFIQLNDGGFALCGSTSSWGLGGHYLGPGGGTDMWLARLDENAALLWNHTYGTTLDDSARKVVECMDGGFALLGISYVNRSGDYDPNGLLVRTDENGDQLWNVTFGGVEWEWPTSLIQCNSGGFAFAGCNLGFSADHTDLWLIRTDSIGNILWNQTYEWDKTQAGASLIETESGFLLFTLGNWGSISIDTTYNDAYLLCTDVNGNMLWNRTYDSGGHDYGFKIIPERAGGYFLACHTGPTQRPWNLWLIRINENGDILWENIVGFNGGMVGDIIKCFDDGFAVIGTFCPGQYWIHTDLFLARTDTQGHVLWQKYYGFEEVPDVGCGVFQLNDSSFLIASDTYVSLNPENGEAWLLCVKDTPITYYTITQFFFYGAIICIITFIIISVIILAQKRWLKT
ncbi:MAG: hypothetical protein ACFE8O_05475 [Candidatus Hermodarchaeota archaeon]